MGRETTTILKINLISRVSPLFLPWSPHGEECMTSLRMSAWEARAGFSLRGGRRK